MVEKAVTMKTRLAAVLAQDLAGGPVRVARICRELGICRQTYYKYKKQFAVEGLAGLVERSRRPLASPNQTPAWLEDEIVRLRKQLADDGWDNGAVSIRFALVRQGSDPVPAVRTIHRVLCRRGLVEPAPAKKPRSAYRRFEYPRTNACWQMDAFEVKLADGRPATVFHLIDDHSRKALAAHACFGETGQGAWACFTAAVTQHGLPAMLLTDNGTAFTGKHHGRRCTFEANLAALGVHAVTSSPYHPQTCGKNERSHQTARRWLAVQAPANDLTELQAHLDAFNHLYNQHRPHQALGGQTPNQRWETANLQPEPNPGHTPPPTMQITTGLVDRRGIIGVDGCTVQVGRQWQHTTLTICRQHNHVVIFHGDTIVHELTLNRTRRYQPNGRPPGGKRIPRHTTH
jgi:transposase InsO family protein/transposase-like protein